MRGHGWPCLACAYCGRSNHTLYIRAHGDPILDEFVDWSPRLWDESGISRWRWFDGQIGKYFNSDLDNGMRMGWGGVCGGRNYTSASLCEGTVKGPSHQKDHHDLVTWGSSWPRVERQLSGETGMASATQSMIYPLHMYISIMKPALYYSQVVNSYMR